MARKETDVMHSHSSIALALLVLTPACKDVVSYELSADHCTYNGGDPYCAERFPERPFCNAGEGPCVIGDPVGCVAVVSPECHAPCGEPGDLECVGDEGSSSGEATATESSSESSGTSEGSTTGPQCMGNADCMDPARPLCSADGECVSCEQVDDPDAACAGLDAGRPVCDAGACVQCTARSAGACEGTTPVCGEDQLCVACTEHDQCPESACHLDGDDRGACFDGSEVVMIDSAMALATAASTLSDGDDSVIVLTAGTDYNVTVNVTANAELALLGPAGAELTGTAGLPSLNVAGSAIVYVAGPSIASGETGLACSGTSVWLDDSEVRNNAQAGMDVSGGCAAHLRRTVVRANGSGGIVASDSPIYLLNTVVGENLDTGGIAGIRIANGELRASYSTIAANLAAADPTDSVQCLGTPTGEVRNSIVTAASGASINGCEMIDWSTSALDTDLGGTNTMVGFDLSWFNPAEGDFHLTTAGETVFMDIAMWQEGDPTTDVDGEPIPTETPSFPGYDQP